MENKVLDFVVNNWEYISGFVLWIAIRVVPTRKNYDVVEMGVKGLGRVIDALFPNRRKDSLGNEKK